MDLQSLVRRDSDRDKRDIDMMYILDVQLLRYLMIHHRIDRSIYLSIYLPTYLAPYRPM